MTIYQTINVDGLKIFYREAGSPNKPTMLLLHGFPSASHMFRNLIPALADRFHLIAPDFPGFGQSSAPSRETFDYTFEHLSAVITDFVAALKLDQFYLYVFDYGAPIGFRIAMQHPDWIQGIVSQNGNIYQEGLGPKWATRQDFWDHPTQAKRDGYRTAFAPKTIIGQYTFGTQPQRVSPDGYMLDIAYTQTPGYAERQLDLIFDYQNNIKAYPQFQAYLRTYQPKLLAVWGKNDPSFIYPGAEAFKRDDQNTDVELVDSGHFALETHAEVIATMIKTYFE
ncbi:alpha/beta hydrolase [Lactiplantibacillus sp. WILCCON 0030]|uniref:Alpha/beta hydrolase n=1 Tax=Lactiplantibacillus brownii TaxID=3069269 RepID=A0ABU1A8N4_9LACO|nr:alpha/beta hydrolase [Lactiplantibacillus brownii]MDQ7937311.1 alpha/beta hydrolase [Lactiplantibacillus brownii]